MSSQRRCASASPLCGASASSVTPACSYASKRRRQRVDVEVLDGDVQPQLHGQTVERAPRAFERAAQVVDQRRDAPRARCRRRANRTRSAPCADGRARCARPRTPGSPRRRTGPDTPRRRRRRRTRPRTTTGPGVHSSCMTSRNSSPYAPRRSYGTCAITSCSTWSAPTPTPTSRRPPTQVVDRGQRLRRRHRVQVGDHEHARAQPCRRRGRRERGEHHEWVVVGALPHQPFRDEPAVQHVVAHPQRVGAERLGLHREIDDLLRGVETPTVGRDVTEANRHIQREGRGGTRSCISSASSARSTPLVTRSSTAAHHWAAYAACDG